MKGFIIYPTYRIIGNKAYIYLFGRLENNQSFLTINEFKPYFFIRTKDLKKAQNLEKFDFEKTDLTNFKKEPVIKISLNIPSEVPKLRDLFEEHDIICYEADIKFAYRFLIDKKIQGALEIEGEYETSERVDRIYKEPELKSSDYKPNNLKIISLDIETSIDGKRLYCLSLYSDNYKKSFIVSKSQVKNAISCHDEETLLENFQKVLILEDPDVITGWNVIDFDLDYLNRKFKQYKIPFQLGRDNSNSKIRIEHGFFRDSKVDIVGRQVLDGLSLLRTSFVRVPDYKLETVAIDILGKKKLIDYKDKSKIDQIYQDDPEKLVEYNLEDSKLVYEIIHKSGIFELSIQRSLLTGMQLDRVSASISSFDSIYLKKARDRKIVCPTGKFSDKPSQITGGYVMESKPGIYDNILIFDFKSVDYSEPIYLLNDKNEVDIMPIGKFVDGVLSNNKGLYLNGLEIGSPSKNWKVLCFNKDYKVKFSKINQVSRHLNNESLYEIITTSGKKIKTTKHHSLFTINKNFKPTPIKSSKLKKGESIIVPLKANLPKDMHGENLNLLLLLKRLQKDKLKNFELTIDPKHCLYKYKRRIKYLKAIYDKKCPSVKELEAILNLKRLCSYPTLRDLKKENLISIINGKIKLTPKGNTYYKTLLVISKSHSYTPSKGLCSINLLDSLKHIDKQNGYFLKWMLGYKNAPRASRIPLLLQLEPLCSLLGYYASEGCCSISKKKKRMNQYQYKVNITAKDLHSKIIKDCEELGLKSYNKKEGFVTLSSKLIYFLFTELFKTGTNAHNKRVPSFIFNQQKKLKEKFLKSYFEGDGHNYPHAQQFGTASEELVNGIALLNMDLGNLGFKIGEYNSFFHCFINDDKFSSRASHRVNYSFRIPKNLIPGTFFEKYKREKYHDTIGIKNLINWLGGQKIHKHIFNGDLGIDTIKEIRRVKPTKNFVYDIGVNPTQNFICGRGGIVAHNSLYPSLMRTFNLDPASYLGKKKEKNSIKSPNNVYFRNEQGIVPEIIQALWAEREKARKEKNELARYAIKILMNSFFGIFASPSFRFFDMNFANAITHFGQYILKTTRDRIQEKDLDVIYGDTDGLFVNSNEKSEKKAEEIGKKIEKEINDFYKGFIKKEYKRDSFLELEFEKNYTQFLMPKIRSGEKGAKKRYAGLLKKDGKEKIETVGIESARRDWTEAAQIFQRELLNKIFHKQEPSSFIKKFVSDLIEGKYDDKLIYRKELRKGLTGYAVKTPHLKAAQKLENFEGGIVEYYMTTDGPEPKQRLKHKLDYDHYINKQIKPIADMVLLFFNLNFEDILKGSKQAKLFGY